MMSIFIMILLYTIEIVCCNSLNSGKMITTRIYNEKIADNISFPIYITIILLGTILMMFGWMIYKKAVFIIGFIMGMFFSIYIIEVYSPNTADLPDYLLYILAAFPIVGGIICGFISIKIVTLLIVITGLIGGGTVGTYILTWSGSKVPPAPARTFLLTVCPCLGAILALLYEDDVVIVSTSIIGSVLIGIGIDRFLEGSTNFSAGLESALTNVGQVPLTVDEITVLVTVLVLTGLGCGIQYHWLKKKTQPKMK